MDEVEYRKSLWQQLLQAGGPTGVPASVLRDLRLYAGQQGIWVDKKRTGVLTPHGPGVTVSVLHTGEFYPNDLSGVGVRYHYPSTQRPAGRDQSEIDATKATHDLGLPVFVITSSPGNPALRDVYLGHVDGWDDDERVFTIRFTDAIA